MHGLMHGTRNWHLVVLLLVALTQSQLAAAQQDASYLGCFSFSRLLYLKGVENAKAVQYSKATIHGCFSSCREKGFSISIVATDYSCRCALATPPPLSKIDDSACEPGSIKGALVFYLHTGVKACRIEELEMIPESFTVTSQAAPDNVTFDSLSETLVLHPVDGVVQRVVANFPAQLYGQFEVSAKVSVHPAVITSLDIQEGGSSLRDSEAPNAATVSWQFFNTSLSGIGKNMLLGKANRQKSGSSALDVLYKPGQYKTPGGLKLEENIGMVWVTYTIDWQPDRIVWAINGMPLHTQWSKGQQALTGALLPTSTKGWSAGRRALLSAALGKHEQQGAPMQQLKLQPTHENQQRWQSTEPKKQQQQQQQQQTQGARKEVQGAKNQRQQQQQQGLKIKQQQQQQQQQQQKWQQGVQSQQQQQQWRQGVQNQQQQQQQQKEKQQQQWRQGVQNQQQQQQQQQQKEKQQQQWQQGVQNQQQQQQQQGVKRQQQQQWQQGVKHQQQQQQGGKKQQQQQGAKAQQQQAGKKVQHAQSIPDKLSQFSLSVWLHPDLAHTLAAADTQPSTYSSFMEVKRVVCDKPRTRADPGPVVPTWFLLGANWKQQHPQQQQQPQDQELLDLDTTLRSKWSGGEVHQTGPRSKKVVLKGSAGDVKHPGRWDLQHTSADEYEFIEEVNPEGMAQGGSSSKGQRSKKQWRQQQQQMLDGDQMQGFKSAGTARQHRLDQQLEGEEMDDVVSGTTSSDFGRWYDADWSQDSSAYLDVAVDDDDISSMLTGALSNDDASVSQGWSAAASHAGPHLLPRHALEPGMSSVSAAPVEDEDTGGPWRWTLSDLEDEPGW